MACLAKGKERRREDVKEKKKVKNKFKDDTRSLNGLKAKRQSMQKL